MLFDLLMNYEEMIKVDKTDQKQIDKCYDAVYMDYFIRPELRITQRAGISIRTGELVDGLYIYPDKKCISELLKQIQEKLNNNASEIYIRCKNDKFFMLNYISEIVWLCVTFYFGGDKNISQYDTVFYPDPNNPSERMANLSDFKEKSFAVCNERALAAYIILCVITNNSELKKLFPFKPFFSSTKCINSSGRMAKHALCGLISRDNGKEIYLFDPTIYGVVEDKLGKQHYISGLFELNEEEANSMFNGEVVEPILLRCKHDNSLTQLTHIAYLSDSRNAEKFMPKYKS